MLRRSNRKRPVPAGRGDAIAASPKRAIRNPHSTVGSSTSTTISGSSSISSHTVAPSVHVSTFVTGNRANRQMSTVTSPSLGMQLAPVAVGTPLTAGALSAADTCSSLVNQSGNIYYHIPPQCNKTSDDLSRNVPVNLKQKIIAGEYIDLALLLINSQASGSDKHTVIVSQGELLIETKQQHKKIVNIETWTDAFLIFTSIYCTAHSLKFQDLLKYIHCIRLGSKRCSGGWKAYDEQFRGRMAQDASSSWAVVDPELWLIYMQNPPSAYGNNFNR